MSFYRTTDRRWRAVLLLPLILVGLVSTGVQAAPNTNLQLEILPIDCQFEIINDGQNTIRYLTPEECGQIIDDDEPGSDTSQPTVVTPTESDSVPFLFAVPSSEPTTDENSGQSDENQSTTSDNELFEPLAQLRQTGNVAVNAAQNDPMVVGGLSLGALAAIDNVLFGSVIWAKLRQGCSSLWRRWWR